MGFSESFSAVAGSGKRRKKKKHSLSFSVNPTKPPAGVRKKWFPSIILASLEALLLKIFGFYNESCSAPAAAPAPAPIIGYLFFFPEVLGAASRALSLPKNKHQKPKTHPRI